MIMIDSTVLIVGSGAAGLGTAEALRRSGHVGPITLLGAERHPPYDRPPLSKQVLSGSWKPERTHLRTADHLRGLDVDLLLADEAVTLDRDERRVSTANGRRLTADALVIATGVRPRELPGLSGIAGVQGFRSLDDALALRSGLRPARHLVVLGDGVLGAEIAASARSLGVDVTMVGPQPAPLSLQLGPLIGEELAALHQEHGVRLRPGRQLDRLITQHDPISRRERVVAIVLDDGERRPADLVVVAVGSVPNTGWLADSGITLDGHDRSVRCDPYCRAADGICAVGDVARWQHLGLGRSIRLENRTNATEQGLAVAKNLLTAGEPTAFRPVPYFWTDQFEVKIQAYGVPSPRAAVTLLDGDLGTRRFVLQYTEDDRVTAVVGCNMPKQTRQHRQRVVESLRDQPEPALA